MFDSLDDKDVKALEALMTASLHVWDHEITTEEIKEFLGGTVSLSQDDEAALAKLGNNPLDKKGSEKPTDESANKRKSEALLALHRKKPVQGFSGETEKEIDRKRAEIRKKLSEKKRRSE